MRVLWFCNTAAGAAEYLKIEGVRGGWINALECAIKDKVELSVAFNYARFSEPFCYNDVKYYPICKKNWKLNIVKNRILGQPYIDEQHLDYYLEIIEQVKPDIIHIHGTENPFGVILGKIDIPIVVSIQGICTVINHKYFSGIEKKYCKQKSLFSSQTSFYKSYLNGSCKNRDREIKNLANAQYVLGRTDWDRRTMSILAPKAQYFYTGEMLRDVFYEKQWFKHNRGERIIITTTMGGNVFKGLETVIEAAALLEQNGVDFEWNIAGVSPQSDYARIAQKACGKRINARKILLKGNLNAEKLIETLLESDIYVMPSHIENSPNNLAEAMILGLPCIATFAGGTGSLLEDRKEGLLIQDGDPWAMAGAIIELWRNPQVAVEYGERARQKALERHDRELIVKSLLEIYDKVTK